MHFATGLCTDKHTDRHTLALFVFYKNPKNKEHPTEIPCEYIHTSILALRFIHDFFVGCVFSLRLFYHFFHTFFHSSTELESFPWFVCPLLWRVDNCLCLLFVAWTNHTHTHTNVYKTKTTKRHITTYSTQLIMCTFDCSMLIWSCLTTSTRKRMPFQTDTCACTFRKPIRHTPTHQNHPTNRDFSNHIKWKTQTNHNTHTHTHTPFDWMQTQSLSYPLYQTSVTWCGFV